jgi:putative flippase GtrA
MGILAAENVATPGKHDLWTINSDSEYVEEAKADVITTAAASHQRSRRRQWIELAQQFGKYGLSGGIATLVDVSLFTTFVQAGIGYGFALMLSYLAGLSVNFWLSRRFVFQVYWRNVWFQYSIFLTVALGGLFANFGLLQLMVDRLNYHPTIARLISALCVFIISFTGHKLYSFMHLPESTAKSNSKVD